MRRSPRGLQEHRHHRVIHAYMPYQFDSGIKLLHVWTVSAVHCEPDIRNDAEHIGLVLGVHLHRIVKIRGKKNLRA